MRTDIQVGDDTRPFFGVSVWQKNMGSIISPGDVILLQSKIYYLCGHLCFLFREFIDISQP